MKEFSRFRWQRHHSALLLWLSLLAGSVWLTGLGRVPLINWNGRSLIGQFWLAMFHPSLAGDFLGVMAEATVTTFAFAVCGTTLSLGVGLVGGVLCSRVWWHVWWPGPVGMGLWRGVRGAMAIPRAIHELIWGLLLLSVLGLDSIVGVLAIAIPFGAITAKVFAEILDETPTEPLAALINSGVRPSVAFFYGHFPQALPNLISYSFYRFECSLRAAAVLGVIGAGGLGQQILISLNALRYEELWTGFYALMLLNGCVDMWSARLRREMGFVGRMELASGKSREKSRALSRRRGSTLGATGQRAAGEKIFVMGSLGAIAIAVPLCFAHLQLDWSRVGRASILIGELAPKVSPERVLPESSGLLRPLAVLTVAIAVVAITLAGIGGVVFSFPAAQNFFLPGGVLSSVGEDGRWSFGHVGLVSTRVILLAARAIPAPILALVILYGMFPGILPGALALAIHNFGILGRLMAEVNENLLEAPLRGLRSLGATGSGIIFYGILPTNLARFLAYILYRWEVCLRETVIVGLVGAGGLGRLMTEQLSSFDYSGLAATLTVFVLLTVAVDFVSGWMRAAVQ